MSCQLPLTDSDLIVVTSFLEQIVARGLMVASSPEIENIHRLVRDHRTAQRNGLERLAYLQQSGLGYFTDEVLMTAQHLAEEVIAGKDRGHLLARVVLGNREALAIARPSAARTSA